MSRKKKTGSGSASDNKQAVEAGNEGVPESLHQESFSGTSRAPGIRVIRTNPDGRKRPRKHLSL